jgi:hypothetical protein
MHGENTKLKCLLFKVISNIRGSIFMAAFLIKGILLANEY